MTQRLLAFTIGGRLEKLMLYLWIKAFHIVYHAGSSDAASLARFCLMERRLYRGIMLPSMLATLILGLWLLHLNPLWLKMGWLHAKLLLVVVLIGYHHICGAQIKRFARGENRRSERFFRWFNELPVVVLLAIVILVVVKPF